VKDFVAQYYNLILYALRDSQPVKTDECVLAARRCSEVWFYNGFIH